MADLQRRSPNLICNCLHCGAQFNGYTGGRNKYCSRACCMKALPQNQAHPVEARWCANCGALYFSKGNRAKLYCSIPCRNRGIAAVGQSNRKNTAEQPTICACGCGQPLPEKRTYAYGLGRPQRFIRFHKAKIAEVPVPCKMCGKVFYCTPQRAIKRIYCSMKCCNKDKRGGPIKQIRVNCTCPICGREYLCTPNMSTRRKTCSKECGITLSRRAIKQRPTLSPTTQRRRMLARRPHRCEICGYDEVPAILTIHHKDRNPMNGADDNVQLVCPNCHAEIHYRSNDGMFSREPRIGRKLKIISNNTLSANEVASLMNI